MSEYYQSPITMSEFTTSYITNGFKNHQSTSYITNGFKNHQSTYKVNKKGSISTIHTSSLLFPCFMDFDGFPMVASQVWCFFICQESGHVWHVKGRNFIKLVVFLLLNNIFNPNNPFFPGITTYQFFFARSGT